MSIFKKIRILILVVLIILVSGFSKEIFAAGSLPAAGSAIGGNIILNDLSGKTVDLSAYKGKPMILFFWTTWCPYCRKEIKILNQMYPQLKKEGINVFAVNVGESKYAVQNFFVKALLSFEVLLDKDGEAADKYNIMGVPTYIFIDKSGHLNSRNILPVDYKKLLLN